MNVALEKRALVVALALAIPLISYGVPYAYAATTSSTYVVEADYSQRTVVPPQSYGNNAVLCNSGDYATGALYMVWAVSSTAPGVIDAIHGTNDATGSSFVTSGTPHGMVVTAINPSTTSSFEFTAGAVCQTPITVAGIGVPEFGSLYMAIALGAVAYFLMARRLARSPAVPARV
jgi:hypothetical protein